ncbi:alpha/beta hydrolase [Bradyrhizobium sp. CCBAU 051011]|jgi:pimeloyl-ACP methyl ester carboxylesterase|uniref:alpha/beta fold hydrolase n=1 Tax=Bradyrhizobium sp. CCBAU 051011 TaxID=858422 RepID=UPI00137441D4|nr:alpha/beta hydrolase [Bradyrhizobium sp. CCBAU 051011]QHO76223.1 alpha/beta hydrolase [Bradyrhizobium sp. CCBAU 051011]
MTTAETVLVIIAGVLLLLVIGNIVFSFVAERKNPPIGRFIDCEGVRLHYIDRGDPAAPCVVLFHGNGSMIQDFILSGLVDHLARRKRVICFDRPGFGYSQRPRLRIWTATSQAGLFVKALKALGVHSPVVLGHSWGALVAVAIGFEKDYPIRGLVLASGYYFPTRRWDFWMMSGPAIPVLGDLVRYTIAPVISWAILPILFRKLFAPRAVPVNFKDGFPASLTLRPKQLRAAAEESAFLIPEAARLQSRYQDVRCPIHIFHGTGDQIIEPEQAGRLHEVLGGSDLHLVRDAGHMVTYVDSATIVQAVESLEVAMTK